MIASRRAPSTCQRCPVLRRSHAAARAPGAARGSGRATATILPANPHFYFKPQTIEEVADTVVARVLDHLGVENEASPRWQEEE